MTKSVNQEPILVPIPKKYLTKNYYFEPNNNNLIYCAKNKKILITGAINKYDGQIFTFDFKNNKNSPCLKCFFQTNPSNELLNCDTDGILSTLAGIVGSIQANEVVKEILNIGNSLCGYILIINSLDLSFRKAKLIKRKNCFCSK